RSLDEARSMGIRVGDPITVKTEVFELKGGLVCGKAFDDRAGCAVLIELLRRVENPQFKLCAAFTVQEEVGLKGATVSAFALNPTVGVAIDTTIAADHPGAQEQEAPVKVGAGPVILVADGRRDSLSGGLIANAKVREWLMEAAERAKVPYQLEVLEGGTTDATAIHLTQRGVPAGVVSIPSRYTHSFAEVISLDDLENCVRLLVEAVKTGLPEV
ncbi:MAG: M42 family peptidase, partial [Thermoprotei archaeon]